jgi:hypothetical protein
MFSQPIATQFMLSCCALPPIHTITIQLAQGWAEDETKWFKNAQEMWRRRGVKAVQMPVHLTIAGGGGGTKSRPYRAEQRRRNALKLDLPAKSGTETRREENNRKASAWKQQHRHQTNESQRASYAVARASLAVQAVKAQIEACGYTGLQATASGGVKVQANRNGKWTYLGTFGDVHEAARAYNDFTDAQPGGRYYNDVEQQMDDDGAPMEFSRL